MSTDPAGPRDGPGPARAPATITHVRPRVSESAARPFPECGAVGDMDRRRAMLTGTSGAKPRPFKSFSALPHNPRRLLEPDHGILKHPGEPSHHHPARSGVSFNRKHCVVEVSITTWFRPAAVPFVSPFSRPSHGEGHTYVVFPLHRLLSVLAGGEGGASGSEPGSEARADRGRYF